MLGELTREDILGGSEEGEGHTWEIGLDGGSGCGGSSSGSSSRGGGRCGGRGSSGRCGSGSRGGTLLLQSSSFVPMHHRTAHHSYLNTLASLFNSSFTEEEKDFP